jgi:hypothetical protein
METSFERTLAGLGGPADSAAELGRELLSGRATAPTNGGNAYSSSVTARQTSSCSEHTLARRVPATRRPAPGSVAVGGRVK